MGVPRPNIPTPPLPLVAQVFARLGMARPTAIEPLAPAWVHANFRVSLAGGTDVLLRRLVADPGVDTLRHEAAALALLRGVDLPVVRNYRIVPPGLLPWPAVISDILPGVQGIAVMRRHPEHSSAICGAVGQFMAQLGDLARPSFGTAVHGLRFVPRRATWRESWSALAHGWWHTARAAGTHLGPLGEAVYDKLSHGIGALDTAKQWGLVHGDLHPSNFLFARPETPESAPPVSGVVDWEGALVGDPLLEWALMVELPVETMGHILGGLGRERVEAVLADADALARLEVYALSRCVRRMSFGAMTLFGGDGGVRRSYALEYGRLIATERLETTVGEKLRAALAVGTSGEVVQRVPAPRAHRAIWQCLDAMRHRPGLTSQQVPALLGGLAAALLARTPGNDPWRQASLAWAGSLGPQHTPMAGEPIPDRVVWAQAQAEHCAPSGTQGTEALALWWLVQEAETAMAAADVPSPLSDSLLRGVESTLLPLSQVPGEAGAAELQLVHALVGLAALTRLDALGLPAPAEATRNELAERLQLAWEDLSLFGSAGKGAIALTDVRERWPHDPQLDQPMVPLLVLALEVLDPHLPAPAARILGALGLAAQEEP